MKKIFICILATFLLSVVGCFSDSQNNNDNQEITISKERYTEFLNDAQELANLKDELNQYKNFLSYLEKNKNFSILVIDAELDAVEKGTETFGSFTDFFVPELYKAFNAGISREEILKRIQRLETLAKSGKFISSYQIGLYQEGGATAVRKHINDWGEGKLNL